MVSIITLWGFTYSEILKLNSLKGLLKGVLYKENKNMKQTFQEFLMRESAINALERISTKNLGQWFEINEMEFSVDKSTIHQDNLLGYAKTREDAQKLMKFMRKKGLIATRTGACGILVLN